MKNNYPNCSIEIISTTFSSTDKSTFLTDDDIQEKIFLPFDIKNSPKYHVAELDHYYSPKHQFSTILQV